MMEERLKSDLRRLAEIYMAATGTTQTALGRAAAADGRYFYRLGEADTGITGRKYDLVVQWLSDNWTPEAVWPDDIVRPIASPPTAPDAPSSETEHTSS